MAGVGECGRAVGLDLDSDEATCAEIGDQAHLVAARRGRAGGTAGAASGPQLSQRAAGSSRTCRSSDRGGSPSLMTRRRSAPTAEPHRPGGQPQIVSARGPKRFRRLLLHAGNSAITPRSAQQPRVRERGAPVQAGGLVEGRVVHDPRRVQGVRLEELGQPGGRAAEAPGGTFMGEQLIQVAVEPSGPDPAGQFDRRLREAAAQRYPRHSRASRADRSAPTAAPLTSTRSGTDAKAPRPTPARSGGASRS